MVKPGEKYSLQTALFHLQELIRERLKAYFSTALESFGRGENVLPAFPSGSDPFARFIREIRPSPEEYTLILLALAPHIYPDFFDHLIENHLDQAGEFPQLGGVRDQHFRGILPTGETALFVLAGEDMEQRLHIQSLFDPGHYLSKQRILWLEELPPGIPRMSAKIIFSQEYLDLLSAGKVSPPRFGINFPAQRIETQLEWKDLILSPYTARQLEELKAWVQHGNTLMQDWGMKNKLKPGYRALFYGPPGTGKTMAVSLLGKYYQKDVYKIDLSLVVSKYIGETEKNLSNLFEKAENKDWILFFDEADALFGKRTNVRDSHDKYANQEISYLLQRIETYDGLVILASNLKSNIDEAFMRRFQSVVYFPMPSPAERWQIWQQGFPPTVQLAEDVDLSEIARQYKLSGANIMNIIQYCCLAALMQNTETIRQHLLLTGIQREFAKEEKQN